jgi:hypothetical protein
MTIDFEDMDLLMINKNFHEEVRHGQKCLLALVAKGKEGGIYPVNPVWVHWIFANAIIYHFTSDYQFPIRKWNKIYNWEEFVPRMTWHYLYDAVKDKDMGKFSSILFYLQTRQRYCPPFELSYTSFLQQDWERMYIRWFEGDKIGQVPSKIMALGNEAFENFDSSEKETILKVASYVPMLTENLQNFIDSTK